VNRRGEYHPTATPLVVAHRGASHDLAEHTLAAYVAAIATGADALECDVRLTRDGHLVCVHDRTVERTSNGRGPISEYDLARLEALDFGSWHETWPDSADALVADAPYLTGVAPDRIEPDGRVLRLETLLSLVRDSSREVRLLIETKHPTRYGGLVEKELVAALARYGWAGNPIQAVPRVTVMSFATTAIRRIRLLAPSVPTVLLVEHLLAARALVPAGVDIVGPGLQLLRTTPDLGARWHARGRRVYVWTVDDPADIAYVLGLQVDAIITNRPAQVRAAVPAGPLGPLGALGPP
jgi:glycerophosphoryl diester phosphodiesterase